MQSIVHHVDRGAHQAGSCNDSSPLCIRTCSMILTALARMRVQRPPGQLVPGSAAWPACCCQLWPEPIKDGKLSCAGASVSCRIAIDRI